MAAWGGEQARPLELDSSASVAPFPGEQQGERMRRHQHQSHTSLVDKRREGIRAKEVEVRPWVRPSAVRSWAYELPAGSM